MRVRFRLLVAVAVFSSVGCASIAGLDDLQEVPCAGALCDEATAGSGGSASGASGAAGAAGKAGASGKAGNAGAGGLAGGGSGGAPGGSAGAAGNTGGTAGIAGASGATFGGASGIGGASGTAGAGGSATCVPKTCAELGAECGEPPDGCMGTVKCSPCADPKLTCGVTTANGNVPFVCGCKPGSYKCDGASLFQCTADGQAYLLAATCDSAAACNAGTPAGGSGGAGGAGGATGGAAGAGAGAAGAAGSAAGVPGTCTSCTAGATLCQGLQPFTCTGGSFVKKGAACAAGDNGAGVCDPSNGGTCRVCAPNAFSCAGPKLQQCDATGTTLTDKATCASGALCGKSVFTGTCVAPVCQTGERRCAGETSQVCGPNRDQYVNDVKCESVALCNNGTCTPPACAVGETKCAGNTLQKCKADRTGFEKDKDCAAPTPACDLVAGKAACTVRGPALANLASAFAYIHSTEVTNGNYNAFLAAGVPTSTQSAECSWNTDFGSVVMPANLPRAQVDWCDAKAYCAWAGMQLCGRIGQPGVPVTPSESGNATIDQWTAFCGGPSNTKWPYGNTFDEAKCNGPITPPNPTPAAVPAGSKPECSTAGIIFDMSGNLAEWENSCVGYTSATDGCNIRGGSFASEAGTGTSLSCTGFAEQPARNVKRADIGFRCCVQ